MARGIGVLDTLRSAVTAPVSAVGAVVTLVGDAGTLLAVALGAYWFGLPTDAPEDGIDACESFDRRRGALVVALALAGLSLTAALKAIFSLPRPPVAALDPNAFGSGPLAAVLRSFVAFAKGASGYGFPSGHALGSTVIYGSLAALATGIGRRTRWLTAAVIVALVSLSRVVLGVHYAIDVLVGCAVGGGFLAAALWFVRGPKVRRAFSLAATLSLLAVLVTATLGADPRDAVTLLGLSTGALAVWFACGPPAPSDSLVERLTTVVIAVVVVGVPGCFAYVLDPVLPIEFLASAAVGATAMLAPRLTRAGTRSVRTVRSPTDQNVSR